VTIQLQLTNLSYHTTITNNKNKVIMQFKSVPIRVNERRILAGSDRIAAASTVPKAETSALIVQSGKSIRRQNRQK
jgi:hypothetical protein